MAGRPPSDKSYKSRRHSPTAAPPAARHNVPTKPLKESVMLRNENVPTPPSPERPPLAPYDPPAPAPQAAAWRQALKVISARPPRASNPA
jgi:hypothetical protein